MFPYNWGRLDEHDIEILLYGGWTNTQKTKEDFLETFRKAANYALLDVDYEMTGKESSPMVPWKLKYGKKLPKLCSSFMGDKKWMRKWKDDKEEKPKRRNRLISWRRSESDVISKKLDSPGLEKSKDELSSKIKTDSIQNTAVHVTKSATELHDSLASLQLNDETGVSS